LVRFRARDGTREHSQFIDVQFAIMILIRQRELHFEKSKYLILRNCLGCRNGSYIVLDRHDKNLRRLNRTAKQERKSLRDFGLPAQ
jgi:hypothetical protein